MAKADLVRTIPALENLAAEHALEFVDAEIVREAGSRYLRIYIDKTGGLTLEDCEAYHRAVVPLVEHLDYDFLEVCSPGLDRPLRKKEDYQKHAGAEVELHLYKPVNGQKTYISKLKGLDGEYVVLETAGGESRFELSSVSVCKLYVSLNEIESILAEDGENENEV